MASLSVSEDNLTKGGEYVITLSWFNFETSQIMNREVYRGNNEVILLPRDRGFLVKDNETGLYELYMSVYYQNSVESYQSNVKKIISDIISYSMIKEYILVKRQSKGVHYYNCFSLFPFDTLTTISVGKRNEYLIGKRTEKLPKIFLKDVSFNEECCIEGLCVLKSGEINIIVKKDRGFFKNFYFKGIIKKINKNYILFKDNKGISVLDIRLTGIKEEIMHTTDNIESNKYKEVTNLKAIVGIEEFNNAQIIEGWVGLDYMGKIKEIRYRVGNRPEKYLFAERELVYNFADPLEKISIKRFETDKKEYVYALECYTSKKHYIIYDLEGSRFAVDV